MLRHAFSSHIGQLDAREAKRTGKLLGRMEPLDEALGSQSHIGRNVYIEMSHKRVVYYSDWPILTNTK